jgi:hypothetical protein
MDIDQEILTDVLDIIPGAGDDKEKSIKFYIKMACKSVALYIGENSKSLPPELSGVVTEMALAKFAKRGNEGKTRAEEEGLTDQWNIDDLAPYISQLNAYKDNKAKNGAGSEGVICCFD